MTRLPVSTYPQTLALLDRQIRLLGSGLEARAAIDAVQQYVTAGLAGLERMTAAVRRATLSGCWHFLAEDLLPVCGASDLAAGEYNVTSVEDLVTCVDCLAVLDHRPGHYLTPRHLHSDQVNLRATCTDGSECAAAHRAAQHDLVECEHHAQELVGAALERSTHDHPRVVPIAWILEAYDGDEAPGSAQSFADLWFEDQDAMKILAADVAARGIRDPLVLGYEGQVIEGRRRLAVAIDLNLATVPVIFGARLPESALLTPLSLTSGVPA